MIDIQTLQWIGNDLHRPECVLCTNAGNLYASDWRGGVTQVASDGTQTSFLAHTDDFLVQPNGIALLPNGDFLLAHLGTEQGGVYRLNRSGELTPFLTEMDGRPLPPTNYVHLDDKNRVWITISTRLSPRSLAYHPDIADGFIVLVDDNRVRIVVDGLGYVNECLINPSGEWLYVNETFARRLSRFKIAEDGSLHNKETVTEFCAGIFPDGLTFTQDGSIWITSIVSNRVIKVDHDGTQTIMIEDCEPDHVAWVEEAFQNKTMGRPHVDRVKSKALQNVSSLAFGGEDLRIAYLGCLLGDRIASFKSDIPGAPPIHWHFDD